jgi:hypothetical protein
MFPESRAAYLPDLRRPRSDVLPWQSLQFQHDLRQRLRLPLDRQDERQRPSGRRRISGSASGSPVVGSFSSSSSLPQLLAAT